MFAAIFANAATGDGHHSLSPQQIKTVNAASVHQGAVAFAWFSQDTFDANFAIDEIVSETQKGWNIPSRAFQNMTFGLNF